MKLCFPPYTDPNHSICKFLQQITNTSASLLKNKPARTDAHKSHKAKNFKGFYCSLCKTVWGYFDAKRGLMTTTKKSEHIKYFPNIPSKGVDRQTCPKCNEPV